MGERVAGISYWRKAHQIWFVCLKNGLISSSRRLPFSPMQAKKQLQENKIENVRENHEQKQEI
jgi:hypothetical protein